MEKFNQRKKPAIDLGNMVFGKVPPQAKDLEEAVLGAIMIERTAFDLTTEILSAESFYSDANKNIYAAMVSLAGKNMPIDLLTVVEELKIAEQLELVGGPYYVSRLTNSVVSGTNIEAHARIVKQKFIQRELIKLGGDIISEAYEDRADAFDLLDMADSKLTSLISGNQKKNSLHIKTVAAKSLDRIITLREEKRDLTGVSTGFREIDKLTYGWQPTDLIILAARPSVGKTAFALNLARSAAKEYLREYQYEEKFGNKQPLKSVVFFSLEMSAQQLCNRLISTESEIWLEKLARGKLDDYEMNKVTQATGKLSELPIFIEDSASLNIFELRAKARRLKNKNNVGLIIIDYLQLMSGVESNNKGNREQEISKISRDLKGLAKELNVPIIALSQLSREVEKRSKDAKIPQLSDLRESGAIEQDADVVMFLYRPEYYDIDANESGESTKGETHVKFAKHRNGTLDTIKLQAQLHIQKFIDMDPEHSVYSHPPAPAFKPIQSLKDVLQDDTPF